MIKIRDRFKEAHPDIAEKLESETYDFLRNDPHLGSRVILLGLGGSYAYGLNTPSSDLDIRGIALNSREEILGTACFEQYEDRQTDTVIYGLKKVFGLLSACNPNIIEMLGLRDEDYAFISEEGQLLLDSRKIFLSLKAASAFAGYADAQLRRIQTASARDRLPELTRQKFIRTSAENAAANIQNVHGLDRFGDIRLHTDEITGQILADMNYRNLPLDELIGLINTMKQVRDEYLRTAATRSQKKDDRHLNKHASHLIRLYHMGCEILETGEINTYRTHDHDLLMAVKNGAYMNEEGLFTDEFHEMVSGIQKRLAVLKETSVLPKKPDQEAIEALLIRLNTAAIENY